MSNRSWAYEPIGMKRRRDRQTFEREARQFGVHKRAVETAQTYGVTSESLSQQIGIFSKSDEASFLEEQGKGGGSVFNTLSKFIGGAVDIAGDVRYITRAPSRFAKELVRPIDELTGTKFASTIAGEIADPIGLLPVGKAVQAFNLQAKIAKEALGFAFEGLEWEQETLGSPTYRSVLTGLAAPMRMAMTGESFQEAIREGWKRSASKKEGGEIPPWLSEVGAAMFSPSSVLTLGVPLGKIPGFAKLGLSGAKASGRASVAKPLASAMGVDFLPLMGAADRASLAAVPRGSRRAQEAVMRLHASLRDATSFGEAGPASLVKGPAAWFNWGINLTRNVFVGHNARLGIKSGLAARMHSDFTLAIDDVVRMWDMERPEYIGPAVNVLRQERMGKLVDFLVNPDHYTKVSPRLNAKVQKLSDVGSDWVDTLRSQYGVDVTQFIPVKADLGAIYVPSVGVRSDAMMASVDIALDLDQLAMLAADPSVIRPKWYQNVLVRMQSDKGFKPQTDLYKLFDIHTQGLSRAAGKEAMLTSVGGTSSNKAKEISNPALKVGRDSIASSIQNVIGRAARLAGKLQDRGAAKGAYEAEILRLQNEADPVIAAILKMGDDFGPEYSYLTSQYRELKASLSALKSSIKGRTTGIPQSLRSELETLGTEVKSLGKQLEDVSSGYRNTKIDPTKLMYSKFTERWHSPKVVGDIARVMDEAKPGLFGDIMDEIRLLVFAADFSPITIQGTLGLFMSPGNAARSSGLIIKSFFKSNKMWIDIAAKEPEWIMRYSEAAGEAPGAIAIRQFGEVAKEKAGLERLPVAGALVRGLNNKLMNMVAMMKYQGWKSDTQMVAGWKKGQEGGLYFVADKETMHVWDQIVPRLNWAERGISVARKTKERMPWISPSFIAAPAIMMKDVTSGLLKLGLSTKLSPGARWASLAGREQLGIYRVTNMIGMLMGISTASAVASAKSRGQTPEEAVLSVFDPTSAQFMSLILLDKGQIGLGGPYRSFIKGLIGNKSTDGTWIPLAGMLPLISMSQGDVVPRFWRGKLNPPLSFTLDMLQNRDFMNRPIYDDDKWPTAILETLAYAAESFTPVTVGTAIEQARTEGVGSIVEDPGRTAINVGAQFAGQNFREISSYDEIRMARDDLSRQHHGKNWEDLEPGQRFDLTKANPDRLSYDATSKVGMAFASRTELLENFAASQQQLDNFVPAGPEWVEAHRRLNIMKSAAITEWVRENPEAAEEQRDEPGDPGEEALGQYFEAFLTSKTAWGDLDNELLALRLNKLESQWTDFQKGYIERNTGLRHTVREKEYKSAQQTLSSYWEIADEVWSSLQERFPDKYGLYGDIDAWMKAQTELLMRRGMSEEDAFQRISKSPVVSSYNNAVSRLRLKLRIANPAIQAAGAKWYGWQSPRRQSTRRVSGKLPSFVKPLGVS